MQAAPSMASHRRPRAAAHLPGRPANTTGNIAFGPSRQAIDMRAVERAAHATQNHDFIVNELKHRYDIGDRGIHLLGASATVSVSPCLAARPGY